jgi:hypothetical protein
MPYSFRVVAIWSLALALGVRDHVMVLVRSRSVVVFQGTSGGLAVIVNGVITQPDAPYGTI